MKNIELVYRTSDMEKGKFRIISYLHSLPYALKMWEKVKGENQNIEYAYLRKLKLWNHETIKILKEISQ